MLVDRDESSDDEDRPLSLKMVKPKKRAPRKKAKEPAGVGGRGGAAPDEPPADAAPEGDGSAADQA